MQCPLLTRPYVLLHISLSSCHIQLHGCSVIQPSKLPRAHSLPTSHCRHSFCLVSTFLIIGVTATAPASGEAVLNPPDEETEEGQEDEEDDYDDGDDDVAFHCCE